MKTLGALVAGVTLAATLGGCGGGSSSGTAGGTAAGPTKLTVVLHDAGSLDALFNGGHGVCTTRSVADAFKVSTANPGASVKQLRALLPKTQVTLADASGTVLDVATLPAAGGEFSRGSGCRWQIQLTAKKPSAAYMVTVTHDQFSKSATVKAAPTVTMTF